VNVLGPGAGQLSEPTWKSTDSLIVAKGGTGNVIVDGGLMEIGGRCVIGDEAGSVGNIRIAAGSRLSGNFSETFVGRAGAGTLRIEAVGRGQLGLLHIGHDPDNADSGGEGSVFVEGDSSTLSVERDMFVGGSGKGKLNVTFGAFGNSSPAPNTLPLMTILNDGEVQFSSGLGALTLVRVETGGLLALDSTSTVSLQSMTTLGNVVARGDSDLQVRQRLSVEGAG
jgi:T5SS/PEP-CTERM-associated repeat protein